MIEHKESQRRWAVLNSAAILRPYGTQRMFGAGPCWNVGSGRPLSSKAMAKIDAHTVARLLREYAQRTSLRGGNPYRVKAYLRAADNLMALSQPLERVIAAGTLTEIPGIGDAIADIVTKLHKTGSHPSLEKLRKEVPASVLELFAVPGLRPDKILKIHQELGITSLAELEAAAKEDRIRKAKGLGAALQTKIYVKSRHRPQRRNAASSAQGSCTAAAHVASTVRREHPDYSRVEIAGDFRQRSSLFPILHLSLRQRPHCRNRKPPADLTSSLPIKSISG